MRGTDKPPVVEGPGASLRRTVIQDLRRGDLARSFRRDLGQIYRFYIDEERRSRLAAMGRVRRFFWILCGLLKSLLMKLSPPRRIPVLALQGEPGPRVVEQGQHRGFQVARPHLLRRDHDRLIQVFARLVQAISQPVGLVVSDFRSGRFGEVRAFATWDAALKAVGLAGLGDA